MRGQRGGGGTDLYRGGGWKDLYRGEGARGEHRNEGCTMKSQMGVNGGAHGVNGGGGGGRGHSYATESVPRSEPSRPTYQPIGYWLIHCTIGAGKSLQ